MAHAHVVLAERLADQLRGSNRWGDPIAVASQLGVRVERRPMAPSVLGATPSDRRIVVNMNLNHVSARIVMAHELGHVLVKRGDARLTDVRAEEQFADEFAAALLVPSAVLVDPVNAGDLAERLQVDVELVTARAQRLGLRVKPLAA
jgi:hypothetical protein